MSNDVPSQLAPRLCSRQIKSMQVCAVKQQSVTKNLALMRMLSQVRRGAGCCHAWQPCVWWCRPQYLMKVKFHIEAIIKVPFRMAQKLMLFSSSINANRQSWWLSSHLLFIVFLARFPIRGRLVRRMESAHTLVLNSLCLVLL